MTVKLLSRVHTKPWINENVLISESICDINNVIIKQQNISIIQFKCFLRIEPIR